MSAEGEQQGLLVCEAHRVSLRRVALHLVDEAVLVSGASLEPAMAMKDDVHDPRRDDRKVMLNRGKMSAREWLAACR